MSSNRLLVYEGIEDTPYFAFELYFEHQLLSQYRLAKSINHPLVRFINKIIATIKDRVSI